MPFPRTIVSETQERWGGTNSAGSAENLRGNAQAMYTLTMGKKGIRPSAKHVQPEKPGFSSTTKDPTGEERPSRGQALDFSLVGPFRNLSHHHTSTPMQGLRYLNVSAYHMETTKTQQRHRACSSTQDTNIQSLLEDRWAETIEGTKPSG